MLLRMKRRLFTAVFETKTVSRRDLEGREIVSTDSIHFLPREGRRRRSWTLILFLSWFNHRDSIDLERERNNSQLFAKQFSPPFQWPIECITSIRGIERRNYDKKIQWVLGSNRAWIKAGDLVCDETSRLGYRETKRFQRDERGRWLWLP